METKHSPTSCTAYPVEGRRKLNTEVPRREPRTILVWGNGAKHRGTMAPLIRIHRHHLICELLGLDSHHEQAQFTVQSRTTELCWFLKTRKTSNSDLCCWLWKVIFLNLKIRHFTWALLFLHYMLSMTTPPPTFFKTSLVSPLFNTVGCIRDLVTYSNSGRAANGLLLSKFRVKEVALYIIVLSCQCNKHICIILDRKKTTWKFWIVIAGKKTVIIHASHPDTC